VFGLLKATLALPIFRILHVVRSAIDALITTRIVNIITERKRSLLTGKLGVFPAEVSVGAGFGFSYVHFSSP
jgi:hypothetical protein